MGSKKAQEGPSLPARRTKSPKAVRWVATSLEATVGGVDLFVCHRDHAWQWTADGRSMKHPGREKWGVRADRATAMRAAEKAARAMVAR